MKLLVQPETGIAPFIAAIKKARKTIDIAIFRFDLHEVEKALTAAVTAGVHVRALIAHTNKGGDKNLRKLELRMLEAGVTVSRTADDLVRYHGKYAIIDSRHLWVMGFNATHLDAFRSRSFGVVTKDRRLVKDAMNLFEADTNRELYKPQSADLVVSPENSRTRLTRLIKSAKKQLYIYDPKISDASILRLLQDRAKKGVDVRVLGKVTVRGEGLHVAKMNRLRLHVRAVVRDGREAFVGSQSLRGLELDRRREVGVIVRHRRIAEQLCSVFEADWNLAHDGKKSGNKKKGEKKKKAKKKKKD